MKPIACARVFAVLLLAAGATCAAAPNDADDAPAAPAAGTLPSLNAQQREAAGIVVAHPVAAREAERENAIGLVLDPTALIAAAADADAAASALRAATAEFDRARGLFDAGAGASRKVLEAAQAEQARTQALADVAAAKFALRWRPVATLPGAARRKLIDALAAGTSLLLRADLPGRHVIGSVPQRALLRVDGVGVPGAVLGVLAHGTEETQAVGLLVRIDNPPTGFGAGARVPVELLGAARPGMLVPRDAVLYDDDGALVFKQLAAQAGAVQTRYAPVRIKLLQDQGASWLVDGLDDDDEVVVHGAGVLWSLQGIVGHAAGDIDDDD